MLKMSGDLDLFYRKHDRNQAMNLDVALPCLSLHRFVPLGVVMKYQTDATSLGTPLGAAASRKKHVKAVR